MFSLTIMWDDEFVMILSFLTSVGKMSFYEFEKIRKLFFWKWKIPYLDSRFPHQWNAMALKASYIV